MKRLLLIAAATASLFAATAAQAGPFILAGTDAEDHGFFSGGANQDGWLFMQRALENIALGVTTPNKIVTILGTGAGNALNAANSAFDNSSLAGLGGWTRNFVSVANFGTFFGAGGNLGTGILMMDSGANVGGGVNGTNFDAHATKIDQFLLAGGGLFSQANGYSWLSTLISGITVSPQNTGGISSGMAMTAAGTAAFPGLTNQDLGTGPYHQSFSNFGSLTVLATGINNQSGLDVILGGRSGSITTQVPEPTSLALVGLALAGIAFSVKRKRA